MKAGHGLIDRSLALDHGPRAAVRNYAHLALVVLFPIAVVGGVAAVYSLFRSADSFEVAATSLLTSAAALSTAALFSLRLVLRARFTELLVQQRKTTEAEVKRVAARSVRMAIIQAQQQGWVEVHPDRLDDPSADEGWDAPTLFEMGDRARSGTMTETPTGTRRPKTN